MGQLFYESKNNGNYSRRDIDAALRHFKNSDQATGGEAKIVVPEYMRDKARAIEKEFKVRVNVAPVSMIHINDDVAGV